MSSIERIKLVAQTEADANNASNKELIGLERDEALSLDLPGIVGPIQVTMASSPQSYNVRREKSAFKITLRTSGMFGAILLLPTMVSENPRTIAHNQISEFFRISTGLIAPVQAGDGSWGIFIALPKTGLPALDLNILRPWKNIK